MRKNLTRIVFDEESLSFVEFYNPEKKVNPKIIRDKQRKPISQMSQKPVLKTTRLNSPKNAKYYSQGKIYSPKRYLIQFYEQNN